MAFTTILLTAAAFATILVTIFIFTLPTRYTSFHSGQVTAGDSNEGDEQSGYEVFLADKDEKDVLQPRVTVQVVVLGDIGRSPRMQYHALSLASCGAVVQLLGYLETAPHPDVTASRLIEIVPFRGLPPYLQTKSKALFLLTAPLKVLYQIFSLYRVMTYQTQASRYMLVQNPPSIPLLAIASIVCFFRNTNLIIDWHNFGYSILALRLGPRHPLVLISKLYEQVMARAADAHFAVTDAMRRVLSVSFGVEAVTLHDRPAELFRPYDAAQQETFLSASPTTQAYAAELKTGERMLLVSPTSWTPDEDFALLLKAMAQYSARVETDEHLPKLLVVITGKGPLKEYFAARIRAMEQNGALQHVKVVQAWLSIEDYASLLASADLGISLHTSSSGVDLPMKVLDMFGAGLPAAGWSRYEAWPELVHEGVNGVGFGSAEELKDVLVDLFSNNGVRLTKLREGALIEGQRRWQEEWMKVAAKLFSLG